MNIKIEIENLNDIENLLNNRKIKRAIGQACALLEREAKEKCPKDTGLLRNSITYEVSENGSEVVGEVFTPLEYAPYVEYGTGLFAEENGRQDVPWHYQDEQGNWHTTYGQHPQPFMRPALDENAQNVVRLIGERLKND